MIWNAGDEFECYECGAGLRRNVAYDKVNSFNTQTKTYNLERVCPDCYGKIMDGPQDDDHLEADSQPPDPLIAMLEARKLK